MKYSQRVIRSVLTAVPAIAFAACSAGAPPPAGTTPAAPAGSHKFAATLRILVPKHQHHWRVRVHGHYISPATQGLGVSISGPKGVVVNETVGLTIASNPKGCAAGANGTFCTVTVSLAPCSHSTNCYTAQITTFDKISGCPSACTTSGANALSSNQNIQFDVAAGKINQVNATLDGIPETVVLVPGPNSELTGGGVSGRFDEPKCNQGTTVDVMSLDADDNYIIGPGAPTPSLVSDNPAALAVSSPAPSQPLTFGLSHPISTTATAVTLVPSVTPLAGSGSTTPVTSSAIVTILGGTAICGIFTEYTISAEPTRITLGPDDALWFTEFLGGKIGRITTGGALTEYSVVGPAGITAGPDHALWFTQVLSNKVGRITTTGALSEFSTGITSEPGEITTGSDNNLWFTEPSKPGVARMTTAGTVTENFVPTGNSQPEGITSGPDGAIYFTEFKASQIGRFPTDFSSVAEFENIGTNVSPFGIVSGPDGNLWFTEHGSATIGAMTTTGTVTQLIGTPTANSGPLGIAAGPDGALWFAETQVGKIGRVTTGGAMTEYVVPTANSGPNAIVTGPDGALWFTECNADKIGRLQ
jgi:virginiamycin B lyase